MKRTIAILLLLYSLIGCKNTDTKVCIEFIDSLKIHLEDNDINVSLVDLAQELKVRPYSLIFDNHLIVLNKRDSFYAFNLDCFKRNIKYERELNSILFKKAVVITDALFGIDSLNQVYTFNKNHNWEKYSLTLPLYNSEPIYENDKYLCYTICNGEFGGLVLFYNKISKKITFAPAQCAVSLMEYKGGFYIISNLAHMDGWSDIILVKNPDLLCELPDSLNKINKWDRISYYYPILSDTSYFNNQIIKVYNVWTNLITSGFRVKGKNYFLTQMTHKEKWKTYLTRLKNDSLRIISTADTIFSSLPASHGEITRKNNKWTVIDFTLFANDCEDWEEYDDRNILLTTFMINDSSLIRINWIKR